VKALPHAGGRDQMFELECNFRALLRQPAIFKRVRKFIGLANAQQELRLGDQPPSPHALCFRGCR
jgi:hypothetical protein